MQITIKKYLDATTVLKYLLGDDQTDTMITCKDANTRLVTYDSDIYQAIGSLKEHDNELKPTRLAKLLEMVDVVSYRDVFGKEKPVLKHERVNELRTAALGGSQ